jgi:hypothetical protein
MQLNVPKTNVYKMNITTLFKHVICMDYNKYNLIRNKSDYIQIDWVQ